MFEYIDMREGAGTGVLGYLRKLRRQGQYENVEAGQLVSERRSEYHY